VSKTYEGGKKREPVIHLQEEFKVSERRLPTDGPMKME